MDHPLYEYEPWGDLRRERASRSHRRRLGIPDGHRQVYGFHVPDEHADPLRYWAVSLAVKFGRDEAEQFVAEQLANNYANIEQLRRAWLLKMGASEVRELIRAVREAAFHVY